MLPVFGFAGAAVHCFRQSEASGARAPGAGLKPSHDTVAVLSRAAATAAHSSNARGRPIAREERTPARPAIEGKRHALVSASGSSSAAPRVATVVHERAVTGTQLLRPCEPTSVRTHT